MRSKDIASFRLINQQITVSKFTNAGDLVHWMGAMQAQDFNMSKLAVGIRLTEATDQSVQSALDKGEILRTHVLRPTWHLVSAKDIHWMLELTAPHIISSLKARHKELGLDEKIVKKSNLILEKALKGGKHLTRKELFALLEKAKIRTDNQRGVHLFLHAEMEGIMCSGVMKGKEQTWALLEERAARKKKFSREESLAKLAKIYFSSHGPATLQDFAWWSGLPLVDARKGLEAVKREFISETISDQTYLFPDSLSGSESKKKPLYLLPAYDEFIISYKDRSASLSDKYKTRSISSNGIFWPVIVLNGQVIGLWKREMKKDKLIITTDFFEKQPSQTLRLMEEASPKIGSFLGLKAELRFRITL